MILTPLQKLPNNVDDLGNLIVATRFEWLPKVQKNRPIWSHWLADSFCPSLLLRIIYHFAFEKNMNNTEVFLFRSIPPQQCDQIWRFFPVWLIVQSFGNFLR